MEGPTIYAPPREGSGALINHPPPGSSGEVGVPLWGCLTQGSQSAFVGGAERSLERLLLQKGSLDLPIGSSSLLPRPQGKDPTSGPGRAGKGPAGPG